jgi:hypothetical protein
LVPDEEGPDGFFVPGGPSGFFVPGGPSGFLVSSLMAVAIPTQDSASEAWTASLSLARGVGFERYGTYVAVGTGASASEGAVGGDPESESATEYTTI